MESILHETIRALECCAFDRPCDTCPYVEDNTRYESCRNALMLSALQHLRFLDSASRSLKELLTLQEDRKNG